MIRAEDTLQQEVFLRLRSWPVITVPIPNSVYYPARTTAERTIIARVISQMKRKGMLVPGAPDLVVLWAGGGAMIELKRPKASDLLRRKPAGRPTKEQADMADRAAALGIHHAFCTSWDQVAARLRAWGVNN